MNPRRHTQTPKKTIFYNTRAGLIYQNAYPQTQVSAIHHPKKHPPDKHKKNYHRQKIRRPQYRIPRANAFKRRHRKNNNRRQSPSPRHHIPKKHQPIQAQNPRALPILQSPRAIISDSKNSKAKKLTTYHSLPKFRGFVSLSKRSNMILLHSCLKKLSSIYNQFILFYCTR